MHGSLLTVLVVDDELPLRQRLKSINWASFGAACIGEARDGEEALSLCKELQPDIVITDITMPVMDGISLLIALNQQYPSIQVVLFTAHSDFDYARKSVQYGALDYLLKMSFTENDLVKLFDRAREKLQRNHIFLSSMAEKKRWEKAREFMLHLNRGPMAESSNLSSGVSTLEGQRYGFIFTDNRNQASLLIEKEVQEILVQREACNDGFGFLPAQTGEWFVFMANSASETYWTSELDKLLKQLHAIIEENFSYVQYEIRWFGVQLIRPFSLETLRDEYLNLQKWKKSVFYQVESPVLLKGEAPELERVTDTQENNLKEELRKAGRDPEQICQFINNRLRPLAISERWTPMDVKQCLIHSCTELFREWGYQTKESEFASSMLQASSIISCLDVMMHAIRNSSQTGASIRSELREVKAIIQQNLSHPIMLTTIAEQVGLSAQYLGRLFRDESGESFNEYMTRLRMETAIHLLNHTNLKVYEVAEKVGIPSYRYFSSVFREWTGQTPSDFKKG